jgi:hypothetical protein
MKFLFLATSVIFAVLLAVGMSQRREHLASRAERDRLLERARDMGLVSELEAGEPTKRRRHRGPVEGRLALPELLALGREIPGGLDGADEHSRDKVFELFGRMTELSGDELESLIDDLQSAPGLTDELRQQYLGFSWVILAELAPAAALQRLGEGGEEWLEDEEILQRVVAKALGEWAAQDPAAALQWAREAGVVLEDAALKSLLTGMAQQDPERALESFSELGVVEPGEMLRAIAGAGKTPEARALILAAFRKKLAALADAPARDALRAMVLKGMADSLSGEGFGEVSSWISSQKLSPAECEGFAAGLDYEVTGGDTGAWIAWVERAVPAATRGERVGSLVSQWTQQDYLAAGQWLTQLPAGEARIPAVCAYAETVAEYDPQVAVQWALTLPAGAARVKTMQRIYQNWPKSDAAAAAQFAREQGF